MVCIFYEIINDRENLQQIASVPMVWQRTIHRMNEALLKVSTSLTLVQKALNYRTFVLRLLG